MATSEDKTLALEIQQAKQQFESQLATLFNTHVDEAAEPIEIDLTQEDEDYKHRFDASFLAEVDMLAEAFHQRAPVRRANVHVHKITAVDSDGDGQLAVNVMYDHRGY